MFGDGSTHGNPVCSKAISRRQPSHGITSSSTLSLQFGAIEPGEFADRQAVSRRNRVRADETLEPGTQRRPFDVDSAKRVRPVEHEHRELVLRCGFEAVEHRRLKRVVPAADVLKVDDERVEAAKLFRGRPQRSDIRAVEAVNAKLTGRTVSDADEVLCDAVNAVFRPEERDKLNVASPPRRVRSRGGDANRPTPGDRQARRAAREAVSKSDAQRTSRPVRTAVTSVSPSPRELHLKVLASE